MQVPEDACIGDKLFLDLYDAKYVRACVLNNACSPPSQNVCRFRFPINILDKIYIKKILIFKYNFLIDLFGDRNVTYIFYKSN
jgi:hypothetical protein